MESSYKLVVSIKAARLINENLEKISSAIGTRIIPIFIISSNPYHPVNTHSDTNVLKIDKTLFINANTRFYPEIPFNKYTVIKIPLGKKWPLSTLINIFISRKKVAILNPKTSSPLVKSLLEKKSFTFIHTKQSYAACSCIEIGDTIVTSDKGIYKTLRKKGIPTQLFSSNIKLPGPINTKIHTGFIGGACFSWQNNTLFSFGYSKELQKICSEYNLKYIPLQFHNVKMNNVIYDFGGGVFI